MNFRKVTILTVILACLLIVPVSAYTGPVNITAAGPFNDSRVDPSASINMPVGPIMNGTTDNFVQNGFGLDFDGVGDYVTVTQHGTINDLTEFTYSVWINPDDLGPALLMDKNQKFVQISGGVIIGRVATTAVAAQSITSTTIPLYQWTLVTVRYDNTTDRRIDIFFNGIEQTYSTQTAATGFMSADAGTDLTIASNGAAQFFNGTIDEGMVFSSALGEGEISYIYNYKVPINQADLEMWIDFDTNVLDQSANNNDGTITGSPEYVRGIRGKADMMFDGTGDYITTAQFDLTGSSTGTLEMWLTTESTDFDDVWGWRKPAGADDYVNFIVRNTGALHFLFDEGPIENNIISNDVINDGLLHHIVVTQNGGLVRMWIDTVLQTTSVATNIWWQNMTYSTQSVWVGDPFNTGGYYNGSLDELRLYTRALSVAEVTEHYQGRYLNESGLELHYDFDTNILDQSGNGHTGTPNGDPEYSDGWAFVPVSTSINGTIYQNSLVNSSTGLMIMPVNAPATWGNYTNINVTAVGAVLNATVPLLQVDEYDSVISFLKNPVELGSRGTIYLTFTSRLDGYVAGPGSTSTMDLIPFTYSGGLLRGATPRLNELGDVTYGNVTAFFENTYDITNYNQPTSRDLTVGIPFSERIGPVIEIMLSFFPIVVFAVAIMLIELGRMDYVSNRIVIYALVVAVIAIILGMYQAVGA